MPTGLSLTTISLNFLCSKLAELFFSILHYTTRSTYFLIEACLNSIQNPCQPTIKLKLLIC